MILKDTFDEDFGIGHKVAVATGNGIRVGEITKISKHPCYYSWQDDSYSVQINRRMRDGSYKKQSFDYAKEKFFVYA